METSDTIREAVREHYGEIARSGGGCGCGPGCCPSPQGSSTDLGYRPTDLTSLPEGADMGLGCGTPLEFAALRPGETVLDLGSGGGIDCFLAASQVGPSGRIIGVDMTSDMIQKARANAAKVSATNVEFRLGEIENLPLPDRSVDAVVSNCVINLSPDKRAVFQDVFRVLKPGGRIAISDIVSSAPLPDAIRHDRSAQTRCISGAMSVDEVREYLVTAGFTGVTIEINAASRSFIKGWNPGSGVEEYVASAAIRAVKPSGSGCCGSASGSSCC